MPMMSEHLTSLEAMVDLSHDIIRRTKVDKVLYGISTLKDILEKKKYSFQARSTALLAKWKPAEESQEEG